MAKNNTYVNHIHVGILSVASIFLSALFFIQTLSISQSKAPQNVGFDEYGYNYNARIFNGRADGVDRNLDGSVWGDETYGNDHLKMTWSKAWDDARFNGAEWTCDAWEDNQWNGALKGGSGETWHYKIVWVGTDLQNSSCWHDGGSPIWGQFEVIFSQGTANGHFWETHANSAGYGVFK